MEHLKVLPQSFLSHPWRFLYDLLMSPLDAAVSLKQIDGVTVHVPEHLDLHVSTGDGQRNKKDEFTFN